MAWKKINDTKLTAIADAIRGKTGKTDAMTPDQMPTEIAGIETGGGSSGGLDLVTVKLSLGLYTGAFYHLTEEGEVINDTIWEAPTNKTIVIPRYSPLYFPNGNGISMTYKTNIETIEIGVCYVATDNGTLSGA